MNRFDCTVRRRNDSNKMADANEGVDQNPPPRELGNDDVGATMETISLTHLNIDCLEKIFSYLNGRDLANVADSNKSLKKDAELVFSNLQKKKKIMLNPVKVYPENTTVCINDLKTCFRMLRCFGHLISKLNISYKNIANHIHIHLDRYVIDYCGATLNELTILYGNENTFKGLSKSFENVEHVVITHGTMFSQALHFKEWFPNMKALSFIAKMNKESDSKNIDDAIQMNPQLRHLRIGDCWNSKILNSISNMPELELLLLLVDSKTAKIFDAEDANIYINNVKRFEIRFAPSQFLSTAVIPLKFDKLEDLMIITSNLCHCLNIQMDFISKHPTINRLALYSGSTSLFDFADEHVLQLKSALPALKILHLDGYITTEIANLIISELTSLERFSCGIWTMRMIWDEDTTELNEFLEYFRNDWQVSANRFKIISIGEYSLITMIRKSN